jgi:lipoyl synthase
MPASIQVVSEYYRVPKEVFLHFSVTGKHCGLMCSHCKGHLLETMIPVADGNMLKKALLPEDISGCLISGGFDKKGKIDFAPFFDAIRQIKCQKPKTKVYLHSGFVSLPEAAAIKESLADAVLVNAIGNRQVIEKVYHLQGVGPEDYMESIRNLQKAGVCVVPHIIAGLEDGKIKGEKALIKALLDMGIKNIVLAALKRLGKNIDTTVSTFDADAFVDLIRYAKKRDPQCKISIGCARPTFLRKTDVELAMIRAGADILSFPSEETMRFYSENKLAHAFTASCCAGI